MSKPKPPSNKTANGAGRRGAAAAVTRFSARRRSAGRPVPALAADRQILEDLRSHIDQLPEINATRVVQLHQRILNQEYTVDAKRVAEKLLAFESEFNQ